MVDEPKTGENKEEKKEEDYKEKMLRIAAEFDNYKKRTKNDVDNAKKIGKAEMIKNLLPVLDEFELALVATKGNSDEGTMKGIEMVFSNFYGALKREGLSEMKASGMFDPYKHEIVMAKEDKKKPGTILEIMKKGYMFGDIVLRPASVIIAKTKEQEPEKSESKENENQN
jgi:molecular chaperone GrpE